ncbi:hypothetical protein BDN72DRAFT_849907 [Pluteus cervinus]|uniref:Uncharacterized protein n=1 Tax=Pluteus cervinus TaxID=181527 RepID=A0ACD3A8S3_9AGAR|nr:hypothetical protein BDN72DRAFT_849907 [Pluteus cervinus]
MLVITIPLFPPWQILAVIFALLISSERFRKHFVQVILAYYAIVVGIPVAFQLFTTVAWTGFYLFFFSFAVAVALCGFLLFKYFMYAPRR